MNLAIGIKNLGYVSINASYTVVPAEAQIRIALREDKSLAQSYMMLEKGPGEGYTMVSIGPG